MKKILLCFFPLLLVACGSISKEPPQTALIIDKETHPMTRNEVINAIGECESNGTRAVVIMSKRRINGHIAEIPVDVHCYPKYRT